ncbi:MAG TPA: hypothetical protein VGE32_09790, partial [Cellvibrio sp.]
LGILFSQYNEQLRRWHWPMLGMSLFIITITALVQTYVLVHVGNYHKAAFVYEGWDLQFIQILFGCIAMLALCRHIRPWLQQHLCWLAELSFPIFFIHPLLTIALENLAALETIKAFFPVSGLGTSLLVFSAVFLVQFYGSAGIAVAIKHLAGTRSRWLIG